MSKKPKIEVLKFPDSIRKRLGTYLGTRANSNQLLKEAVENSIDQAFLGKVTKIIIRNDYDNKMNVVMDDGVGMPISLMECDNVIMTEAEVATTKIHSGTNFNTEEGKISVGMNGIGIKGVNAVSDLFIIATRINKENYDTSIPEVKERYKKDKNDIFYLLEFSKGLKVFEGAISITEIKEKYDIEVPEGINSITAFIPDGTILYDINTVVNELELSYSKLILDKFYNGRKVTYIINGKEFTDDIKLYKYGFNSVINSRIGKEIPVFVSFEVTEGNRVSDFDSSELTGSVISLPVNEGVHVNSIKTAFKKSLKDYFSLSHGYLFNGVKVLVVSLPPSDTFDFDSQIKTRVTSMCGISIGGANETELSEVIKSFKKIFKSDPEYFKVYINKLEAYSIEKNSKSDIGAIRKLSDPRTNKKLRKSLDSQLKDAYGSDKLELFTVEGTSAGGNITKSRNLQYQGQYDMRGYGLNAISVDDMEFLSNKEYNAIDFATRFGTVTVRKYNEKHGIENPKYRYRTLNCATDADADGLMINAIQAGTLFKKYPHIIDEGRYRVIESPLYKQGDKYFYYGEEDKLDRSKPFRRFKGLGELNVDDAEVTLTTPGTRRIYKITRGSDEESSKALQLLSSPSARKEFLIAEGILTDPYNVGY